MKKFLKITIIWLLFIGNSYAIENWEIEKVIDGKYTQVSTTGLITYGAEYKLLISNNNVCKAVEDNFVFYTTKNNPNIMKIIGKKVKVKTLGVEIYSEIRTVYPAMLGHLVWFTNGLYDLEQHGKFLDQHEKLIVNLINVYDNSGKKIAPAEEFFDELTNSWNLKNVYKALKEGKKMCLGN